MVDSRLSGDGDQIRRRRQCSTCKERFTTYETAELNMPQVVKQDGSRVPFDEDKLRAGMERALEKRPVSAERVDAAISHITRKLTTKGEREIPSLQIGDLVMDELKRLDQVAYVRFASVYRKFEDVNAFREEIERLERQPTPEQRRQQLKLPISDKEKNEQRHRSPPDGPRAAAGGEGALHHPSESPGRLCAGQG
ncbi:transcriptional repressor NrdR [endosymbiont of Tevnia jerichonana (vent Tica)]|uniref:Transcriptional repressor NrdR n=1 Tax=endosymbiont of Tevnia jerichonana (vent Tica) TaxID=1049564 RepID=G2FBW3_9GAMM|nr:transcriptional repressor NrdR [endosymbiont of Tevnia jerichonana (vent Tica)]